MWHQLKPKGTDRPRTNRSRLRFARSRGGFCHQPVGTCAESPAPYGLFRSVPRPWWPARSKGHRVRKTRQTPVARCCLPCGNQLQALCPNTGWLPALCRFLPAPKRMPCSAWDREFRSAMLHPGAARSALRFDDNSFPLDLAAGDSGQPARALSPIRTGLVNPWALLDRAAPKCPEPTANQSPRQSAAFLL